VICHKQVRVYYNVARPVHHPIRALGAELLHIFGVMAEIVPISGVSPRPPDCDVTVVEVVEATFGGLKLT
jgi:hypothetical protein